MVLTRRRFLKSSAVAATGLALAACVPAEPSVDMPAGTGGDAAMTEITYLIRSDIGVKIQEWTDEAIADFATVEPNITIETIGVPWGDYNAKLLAQYAAGDPPEISANYAAGFPTFYANDAIVALDELVSENNVDLSVIEQAALDAVTRNGKLWALPLAHLPTIVYYNLDALEEAGARVPPIDWADTSWTTDAMLASANAAAKDMDDPTEAQYGMIFGNGQLGVFEWLWGADPFNDVGGPEHTEAYRTGIVTEAFYDSETMNTFIGWVYDAVYGSSPVSPRPSDTDAIQQLVGWPMMSGRIGMAINGAWSVTNFAAVEPSWRWGVGAFPYGPAGVNTSPLFNDSWMLGKGAKEQDAGFRFLQYLAVEKGAELYAKITGFFPAHKENYPIYFDSLMNIPNFALSREDAETALLDAFNYGYVTPGKTLDSYPEWNRTFNQTMGPIWNAEVSVADGLAQVQAQFESVIESKS